MDKERISLDIVAGIIDSLDDRSGLGDIWDSIDQEIKDEIIIEWRNIVENNLPNS